MTLRRPACLASVASLLLACAVAVTATAAASAASADASAPCAELTLCARLGGPAGLAAIANALVDLSVHDPRTAAHWERVDHKRVKEKLSAYLCVLTGGQCDYQNDDIRTIHAGQHIRSAEFYALVENLRAVLAGRGVAEADKNALLALLAVSKRDVVEP